MFSLIPREVVVKDGKIVAAGLPCSQYRGPEFISTVIDFPTDHYDFLGPVNPVGKTVEEVQSQISMMEYARKEAGSCGVNQYVYTTGGEYFVTDTDSFYKNEKVLGHFNSAGEWNARQ